MFKNIGLLKENRNFRLLMIGNTVSVLGTEMQNFVLSLYILSKTGSALLFAILLTANFLPSVLFESFSGALVDRFDKKKFIVNADILSGITTLILFLIVTFIEFNFAFILITVFLLSTINTLFSPAIKSSVPLIVGEDNLVKANSIEGFISSISQMISPVLAGILVGIFSVPAILLFNGISFLFSAFSESQMDYNSGSKLDNNSKYNLSIMIQDTKEGFHYIKNDSFLKSFISSVGLLNLFLTPLFAVVMPYIVKVALGYSDRQFSISESILMVGVVIGMSLMNILEKKLKLINLFKISVLGLSVVTFFIGLVILFMNSSVFTFPIILLLNLLLGMLAVFLEISTIVILQKESDEDKIGRVFGAFSSIKHSFLLIGQLSIAILMDRFNPGNIMIILAVNLLILAFYIKCELLTA